MAQKMICLDTSILIEFFRKKNKDKSTFFQLTENYSLFGVSVITEYEIFIGSTAEQHEFWEDFFKRIVILPFNTETNKIAIDIHRNLKIKNKLIEIPDILIAATAINNGLKLATNNNKHFARIQNLEIVQN